MTRRDAAAVAQMARELAAVLKDPEPALDPNDLVRDGIGPERWFDCLVAEVDGRLIGYAMVCRGYEAHMAKRRLWLSDLYVRTDAQRTGAGHALMVENRAAGDRTRLRSRLLGSVAAQPRGQSFLRASWSRRNRRSCHLACWQPSARGGGGRMTFAP